jgi:hypothetical protein
MLPGEIVRLLSMLLLVPQDIIFLEVLALLAALFTHSGSPAAQILLHYHVPQAIISLEAVVYSAAVSTKMKQPAAIILMPLDVQSVPISMEMFVVFAHLLIHYRLPAQMPHGRPFASLELM